MDMNRIYSEMTQEAAQAFHALRESREGECCECESCAGDGCCGTVQCPDCDGTGRVIGVLGKIPESAIEWLETIGEWSYGVAPLPDDGWAAIWHSGGPVHPLPVDGPGDENGMSIHATREEAVAAVEEMVAAV